MLGSEVIGAEHDVAARLAAEGNALLAHLATEARVAGRRDAWFASVRGDILDGAA